MLKRRLCHRQNVAAAVAGMAVGRREEEERWLNYLVMRLRMLLRYAQADEGQAILKELISEAETRLESVGNAQLDHES